MRFGFNFSTHHRKMVKSLWTLLPYNQDSICRCQQGRSNDSPKMSEEYVNSMGDRLNQWETGGGAFLSLFFTNRPTINTGCSLTWRMIHCVRWKFMEKIFLQRETACLNWWIEDQWEEIICILGKCRLHSMYGRLKQYEKFFFPQNPILCHNVEDWQVAIHTWYWEEREGRLQEDHKLCWWIIEDLRTWMKKTVEPDWIVIQRSEVQGEEQTSLDSVVYSWNWIMFR